MSDDMLRRADRVVTTVNDSGYNGLIRDLAARVRELEAERLTHGNVMGRIAIALFSDQNNRTDEECVAAVAELSYERSGAIQRAKRAETERNTLRALLREARDDWIKVGYGASHEDVAACRDVCDRIDNMIGGSK